MPSALRTRLYAVLDRGAPAEIGTNPTHGGRRCGILFAREREGRTSARGPVDCRCPTRTPRVANGNFFSTSVGFAEAKSGEPGRKAESACSNEDTVATLPLSRAGRHAPLGRAGRDCGQFHPDGVLSCATEHLSRYRRIASRTRMDERKITTQDHIRLRMMLAGLRQKERFCDGK